MPMHGLTIKRKGLWRPLMGETEAERRRAGLLIYHAGRTTMAGSAYRQAHQRRFDYTEAMVKIKTLAALWH